MRSKKTYIVLIIILFIFFAVMFLLFGLDNIKKEGYSTTIVVGEDTIWNYDNKRWFNYSKSYSDFNWKEFTVYLNNEKYGNYYLWHNDKWYAFDKDKNAVNLDGNLLAFYSNHNISVFNFNEEQVTDDYYINKVLADNDIPENSNYTSKYMIYFDYDNDGVEEEFYLISNVFPIDFVPEKIFSLVFMVKDEEIYPIYTDISKNTSFNGCKPYFNTFIDVDEDSHYEFVLSCGRYSVSSNLDMLYKFIDNEFKIIISNQ